MQTDNFLSQYEENKTVGSSLENILHKKTLNIVKIRHLKQLRNHVHSPLAKSHAEYFIRKLYQEICSTVLRIIRNILLTFHTVFVLTIVYWYYYPEQNWFAQHAVKNDTQFSPWYIFALFFQITFLFFGIYFLKSLFCFIIRKWKK